MPEEPPEDVGDSPQATPSQRTSAGAGKWVPPSPEHLQRLLPQYEVIEMLGHGGMGAVYKARQISLDRLVAIKILPPDIADEADVNFTERFINEARTMAKMNHPAIVHVHDFGQTAEGQLYFVMEYVDGTDVAKMIQSQGKLPPDYALAITAHVCDALKYAHEHGVIHRDIKPANVLINMEGQVKVADFGLAKANDLSQESGLTKPSMTMGTPDFIAPEALTIGMTVDQRADLYAVGVMLYNMLTGKIPRGAFDLPSVKSDSDPRFDAIVLRAMKTDPAERYQSAAEVRRDLDVILTVPRAKENSAGGAIPKSFAQKNIAHRPVAQRPGMGRPAYAPVEQKKSGALWIFVVVALLTVGGFIAWREFGGTKTQPEADGAQNARPPEPNEKPAAVPGDNGVTSRNAMRDNDGKSAPAVASTSRPGSPEVWTDWLAAVRKKGVAPSNFAFEADGLRSPAAGSVSLICGATMRDGAVRVTFVPPAGPGVSGKPVSPPALYIRHSGFKFGSIKSYSGNVSASSKKSVMSVSDQTTQLHENHVTDLPAGFDAGKEFTMELRAEGNVISLALNGQRVSSLSDTRIREGFPVFLAPGGYLLKKVEVLNLDVDAPAKAAAAPPVSPPAVAPVTVTTSQGWVDWLAQVKKSGVAPGGFALEADGLRATSPGSAYVVCSAAPMRNGALRVTFVPSADGGRSDRGYYVPVLNLRRSVNSGPAKSYHAAVLAFSKKLSLGVVDVAANVKEVQSTDLPAGFDAGKEFTMELRAEEDAVSFSLNGEVVSSLRDTRVRTGFPALNVPGGFLLKKVEVLNLDSDSPARTSAGPSATAATSPAARASAPTVNLLASLDFKRNAIAGSWAKTADGLSLIHKSGANLFEFNHTPPEEYDFEIEFTMTQGNLQVEQVLPAGGHSIVWKSGDWFGFDPLDGVLVFHRARTEATVVHDKLKAGRRYRSVVEVRKDSLRVLLDGEELLRWRGDVKRLGDEGFELHDSNHLGVGSWNTSVLFHKVEVREVPVKPNTLLPPIPPTLLAQYTAALARSRDAASVAEKSAYEDELARLKSDLTIPAIDDAGIPDALKKLREILRQEIAKKK